MLSPLFDAVGTSVPDELKNEPFSYEDSGLRPEIRSSLIRPQFLFMIDVLRDACWVQGTLVASEWRKGLSRTVTNQVKLPSKNASGISVVSVYDLYGLDVALSFIKYLIENWDDSEIPSAWVRTYLLGSLCILDSSYKSTARSTHTTIEIANLLAEELSKTEDKEPKMLGSLVALLQPLPEELVARITGNPFVSTSVTRELRVSRCQVPTLQELTQVGIKNRTFRLYDGSYEILIHRIGVRGSYRIQLTREMDAFKLDRRAILDSGLGLPMSAIPVAFSLRDYSRWFKRQGCPVEESIVGMLEQAKRQFVTLNEDNIHSAMGWYVQLLYDRDQDSIEESRYLTFDQLRDELSEMLTDAIENPYW